MSAGGFEPDVKLRSLHTGLLAGGRFGLRNHPRGTLEEVGLELGVTRERVRQIQMDALRKLRRILEHSGYSRENIIEE